MPEESHEKIEEAQPNVNSSKRQIWTGVVLMLFAGTWIVASFDSNSDSLDLRPVFFFIIGVFVLTTGIIKNINDRKYHQRNNEIIDDDL